MEVGQGEEAETRRERTLKITPPRTMATSRPSLGTVSTVGSIRPASVGSPSGDPARAVDPRAPSGALRMPIPSITMENGNQLRRQTADATTEAQPTLQAHEAQFNRVETLVEVACRWSRTFSIGYLTHIIVAECLKLLL